MKDLIIYLGQIIKELRRSQRYTLKDVSEKTGLAVSFLSEVERGRTNASIKTLIRIGKLYNISISSLISRAEIKEYWATTSTRKQVERLR